MLKVSHDSFAQFAASGDFMFDTQQCDFTELQLQLDKAEGGEGGDHALEKFDFCQLVQTQEDIDEFPEKFKEFLSSIVGNRYA